MPLNLSSIVTSSTLAEPIDIHRVTTKQDLVDGEFIVDTITETTSVRAVVSNTNAQDYNFLSAGGGVQMSDYRVIHTDYPLRAGSECSQTVADEVVLTYQCNCSEDTSCTHRYKIISINDRGNSGYVRAIGVRVNA